MKALLFFVLVIFTNTHVSADTYTEYLTYTRTVDGTPAPSCAVVSFRLQEFIRRELEVEDFIEWYSPLRQTPEQRSALMNFFRRMPFFYTDRVYEHLYVFHEWKVDPAALEAFRLSDRPGTAFSSSRHAWSDPYNGRLPDDIAVELRPGVVRLRQQMSFERFCLEDPEIILGLEAGSKSLTMLGQNSPELL